ncbi:hypothetical protein [Mesorhizobium sp. M7A.F.Ca.MR.362.00.0.0]|uniref:ADP-ribosyltransferase-containing protein n=1 Tax=Mesorhizobium sp. M7A.F.Ca.MR.362.00.0.0 TaxID=2496779 RepID=UPI000FD2C281|nr:hypothetical protein [Mesorhizobium sp. M7A.F.Ca.MR.362.00.0.0]RUU81287.1 hypothetical protein EOC06_08760 [Mesorhizobium sp. M7A.F.Ca.MR.362.00.0.0]
MSGVYSMTSGPTYAGASRQDLFDSAMNQPLNLTSTLVDQAKGGILESFGLGTAIKDLTTPQGNEAPSLAEPLYGMAAIPIPGAYSLLKSGVQSMMDQGQPLTEDAYRGSAFFRKDIPWDQGMTDARAAALAASDDAKKVREYYATKRPFSSFVGAMAGQALDPVNYVPVFGEAVQAAAIGRFGYVAGRAIVAGADAALNTGIAGLVTSDARAKFGDDVSWTALTSQMASAALIGSAFGAVHGALGRRVDARAVSEAEQRLATLKTTQEARIALNEGIDAIANGEDIKLSPNATEPMARVAGEIGNIPEPETVMDSAGAAHEIGGGTVPERGLVVANQYADGKIYIGNPGDLHFSVHDRFPHSLRGDPVRDGFVTPDGQFLDRAQALSWVAANEKAVRPSTNMGKELDALDYREQVPDSKRKLPGEKTYYHGGKADLTEFSDAFRRDGTPKDKHDVLGIYVTENRTLAEQYIGKRPDGVPDGKIHEVHIDVKNPLTLPNAEFPDIISTALSRSDVAKIKAAGYDAIINPEKMEVVLFDGSQVRRKPLIAPPAERAAAPRTIDTTAARPDPAPEGVKQAEASVAKPEDTKNLAEQYRVDTKTGSFAEEGEVAQLAAEGRLTEEDAATLAQAQIDYETGSAYAEALKSVAGCLL